MIFKVPERHMALLPVKGLSSTVYLMLLVEEALVCVKKRN